MAAAPYQNRFTRRLDGRFRTQSVALGRRDAESSIRVGMFGQVEVGAITSFRVGRPLVPSLRKQGPITTRRAFARPVGSVARDDRALFGRLRRGLLRREAAVEGLTFRRHLFQELRRRKARAVFLLELVAELDELPGAHEVDIGQRAAGERRKAE